MPAMKTTTIVTLYGGPLDGMVVTIPHGTHRIRPLTPSGDLPLYVITTRSDRRGHPILTYEHPSTDHDQE